MNLEDWREIFEIRHEMTYHEMCGVIEGLRAEVERLRAAVRGLIHVHSNLFSTTSAEMQAAWDAAAAAVSDPEAPQ